MSSPGRTRTGAAKSAGGVGGTRERKKEHYSTFSRGRNGRAKEIVIGAGLSRRTD